MFLFLIPDPADLHLLPDPVHLLLHLQLLEDRAEGIGDDQHHDEETNYENEKGREDSHNILSYVCITRLIYYYVTAI